MHKKAICELIIRRMVVIFAAIYSCKKSDEEIMTSMVTIIEDKLPVQQ